MSVSLYQTADQSFTLYRADLDETYHSRNGAVEESLHVFLKEGLNYYLQLHKVTDLNIFEVGFGTGLNAALTEEFARKNRIKINYEAVETKPLDLALIKQLKYDVQLADETFQWFMHLHEAKWNSTVDLHPYFTIRKHEKSLLEFEPQTTPDIIYFDAFAPDKQPEMWSEDVFSKLYEHIATSGVLTTYSAKGAIKRLLMHVGFDVEKIAGPPRKRHMLRATKR
ncbi:MAG: tRNA (5-methylaminomethyl-2-thiouridine)(34)-methyltransferase MnmD [Bacteroidia bacterium]|jgi:tRNA U34 5-methylaminomethyl-2-thiouridine-forming methyltransferase MnmC|nr:tRNA (5-methylaminomethyl-2-thiouridine)(34)-methyltransferase MnmD [Bacteroidia bacterium]